MPPSVLMLGWGYPPNITGGLDVHVGELFSGLRDDLGVDATLVLPAEFAPDDRARIEPVETGEGTSRTASTASATGLPSSPRPRRDPHARLVRVRSRPTGPRASDATWVSSFHSLASDRNINPPTREVETERRLANAADTNIAVSELVREDIRELYGADSRVVYNGFSTPTFSGKDVREDLGIDGEMVFFVGRHTDQKDLAPAVRDAQAPAVTLVVGGWAPDRPVGLSRCSASKSVSSSSASPEAVYYVRAGHRRRRLRRRLESDAGRRGRAGVAEVVPDRSASRRGRGVDSGRRDRRRRGIATDGCLREVNSGVDRRRPRVVPGVAERRWRCTRTLAV